MHIQNIVAKRVAYMQVRLDQKGHMSTSKHKSGKACSGLYCIIFQMRFCYFAYFICIDVNLSQVQKLLLKVNRTTIKLQCQKKMCFISLKIHIYKYVKSN
jgi:hypothetical protein